MQGHQAVRGGSTLDRDAALQVARERFEAPLWALLGQLETTLADLGRVKHINISDPRAVGSVLNSALSDAAFAVSLAEHGLEVTHVSDGRSNKLTGSLDIDGGERIVSFELHLSGPRGGTSKSSHQFARSDFSVCDIEEQRSLFPYNVDAPDQLLFFIACHLSGTGVSVARAFLKFADGVDQRMIEIHRAAPILAAGMVEDAPIDEPAGAKLTVKKPKGEKTENGSTTDKRRDAASSSK